MLLNGCVSFFHFQEEKVMDIELAPLQSHQQQNQINYDQLDADLEYLLLQEDIPSDADTSKPPLKESNKGQSSVAKATFNMTKTIVGAGVFGIPLTFQKAGFFTAVVLIILMAFYINWTLQVLLRAGLQAKVD